MAISDADIDRPIDWKDPRFATMLAELQGHILKHHGRDHTNHLFLRFDGASDATKAAIRTIGGHVLSALAQLRQVEEHRVTGSDGGPVVLFYLSASGYAKLGLAPPQDPAFLAGMRERAALADPPASEWEAHHGAQVDALLIIGDINDTEATRVEGGFLPVLQAANITILGRDVGRALKDANGVGHEHFGYVDGISQPLMLQSDVDRERDTMGIDQWDPAFGPGDLALVRDPHGTTEDSFGSYLVYRKLEQDVRGFKTAEEALGLVLPPRNPQRAGAMVVGRFENGTPAALHEHDTPPDATNNFVYAGAGGRDPLALMCPFQGHIRKTNPRGDTGDLAGERTHLMPRRGIPYGERADDWQSDDPDGKPTHGVGLIFMAFNRELERQFEFTQIFWANNPDFIFGKTPSPGLDPIIGQGPRPTQFWPTDGNNPAAPPAEFLFEQFVTLRGGEYFFAPSVGFLKSIS